MSKEINKILIAGTEYDIRDSRFDEASEAETARQTAETARQEAEQGRVTAEQQRADAEAARAEEFATFEGKIAAKEDAANKVTSIGADANNTTFPTTRAVLNSIAEVKNIEVTPEMLSESTKQYINASGGGTITNLADDEDLTSVNNLLKFANKDYSPASYSGMGRVYLRKNMVDGKNILTQEMMTKENTIYIIQYDYDLNGATINVPANCTLDFQGGSFVNGTINFNDTYIEGFSNSIKCLFSGTIKSKINVCLFGVGSTTEDRLQDLINIAEKQSNSLYFPAGTYNINKKYNFRTYLNIVGDGEDTIFNVDDNCGFYCVCENKSVGVRLYLNNFMALGKYTTTNNTITSKFIVQDCLDSDIKENTDVSFPWINNSNISHCIFKYFYTVIEWKYGFYWGEINNNWFNLNYIGLYLANANSVNISQNSFRDNYDTDIILTGSKRNAVNSGTSICGNDFSGARYAAINVVNAELHYATIEGNYCETASGSHIFILGGKYGEDYNGFTDGSNKIKRAFIWKSYICNAFQTAATLTAAQSFTIYIDEGRIQFSTITGNIKFNEQALGYYQNQSYKNVISDSYKMEFNANVYRSYYRENLSKFAAVNKINHNLYNQLYVPTTPVYNGIAVGEETCIREFSGWVSIPAQSSIRITEFGTVNQSSFNTSRVYVEFFNSRNSDIVLHIRKADDNTNLATYESTDFYYMKNMYSLECKWSSPKKCYVDTDISSNIEIRLYNKGTKALASYVTIKIYTE